MNTGPEEATDQPDAERNVDPEPKPDPEREFEPALDDFPLPTQGVIAFLSSWFFLGIGLAFSPMHLEPAFYETAAQVIPVLLLAAVVEGRAYRLDEMRGRRNRQIVGFSLFLVFFGEGAALYSIATGCSNGLTGITTIVALLNTAGLVFLAALHGPQRPSKYE